MWICMTYMFSSLFTGDPKTPEVGFELSNHMDSQWRYGRNEFRAKGRRERGAEVCDNVCTSLYSRPSSCELRIIIALPFP